MLAKTVVLLCVAAASCAVTVPSQHQQPGGSASHGLRARADTPLGELLQQYFLNVELSKVYGQVPRGLEDSFRLDEQGRPVFAGDEARWRFKRCMAGMRTGTFILDDDSEWAGLKKCVLYALHQMTLREVYGGMPLREGTEELEQALRPQDDQAARRNSDHPDRREMRFQLPSRQTIHWAAANAVKSLGSRKHRKTGFLRPGGRFLPVPLVHP